MEGILFCDPINFNEATFYHNFSFREIHAFVEQLSSTLRTQKMSFKKYVSS